MRYSFTKLTKTKEAFKSGLIKPGNLTYVSEYRIPAPYAKRPNRQDIMYVCLCNCGRTTDVYYHDVIIGKTKSCPACNKVEGLDSLYKGYQESALKRGYEFKLDKLDFGRLTKMDCHYCGAPPSQEIGGKDTLYIYNGLDRVDNKIGYLITNVVPCCSMCNFLKGKLDDDKFIDQVAKICSYTAYRPSLESYITPLTPTLDSYSAH